MLALQLALFLVPPLALALTVYHRDDVWIRRWIMHRDTKDYLGVVHSHFEERSKILTPEIEPSNASTPAAPSKRPLTLPVGRWHIALNELKIIKENEATTGDNCTATKITAEQKHNGDGRGNTPITPLRETNETRSDHKTVLPSLGTNEMRGELESEQKWRPYFNAQSTDLLEVGDNVSLAAGKDAIDGCLGRDVVGKIVEVDPDHHECYRVAHNYKAWW